MRNIVKHKIKRIILSNKWYILFELLFFAFLTGSEISHMKLLKVNFSEFVLMSIVNHYHILYLFLPIILLIILNIVRRLEPHEILRFKNRTMYISVNYVSFLIMVLVYVIVHILMALFIGITSFELSTSFSHTFFDEYDEILLILDSFSKVMVNSGLAIICTGVYMVIGLGFIYLMIIFINDKFGNRGSIAACVGVLISVYLGFKTELSYHIPILALNNFFIFHHALLVNGVIKFGLVLAIISSGNLLLLYNIKKRNPVFEKYLITGKVKILTAGLILILLTLEVILIIGSGESKFKDLFFKFFMGSYLEEPSFMGWLRVTILYFIPIFAIGNCVSNFRKNLNNSLLIRYRSKKEVLFKRNIAFLKFSLLYSISTVMILLFIYCIGDKGYVTEAVYEMSHGVVDLDRQVMLYSCLFVINQVFLSTIYVMLSDRLGEITTFIGMIITTYISFLMTSSNHIILGLSFGTFLGYTQSKIIIGAVILMMGICSTYYLFSARRRF